MDFIQTMKYFLLIIAISPCWSQMEMRPDVTFDDRNDRYDISSLLAYQNRYYEREEPESIKEYRRNLPMEQLAAEFRKKVKNNKDFGEFAYHDQMNSDEGGDESEFNRNLMNFRNSRRFKNVLDYFQNKYRRSGAGVGSADLEKEASLHYAVPINMKINGYIQAPLVD